MGIGKKIFLNLAIFIIGALSMGSFLDNCESKIKVTGSKNSQKKKIKFTVLKVHQYITCWILAIFFSLVAPMIMNQSMIAQIPNPPHVSSFPIPNPVSPIINRSIPKLPPSSEMIKIVVGSLNCIV